jgi:queuine tRNA-ribosyltransferase
VKVTLEVSAVDGSARTGTATTPRGTYGTPCFMPVGTRGAVKYLSAEDYERLGAEVVLANTYHLMLRPGADVVAALGGVGAFTGWNGLTLTDSGGYQVFSLEPDVDDDGVTFRSVYDGSMHRLTPESAVALQEQLGADIQMALDVCPALPSPPEIVRQAMDRTLAWAKRARPAHGCADQALFGIVQGGVDEGWRAEAARDIAALEFDGYGIGGLSVGETRAEMLAALAAAVAELPPNQPRYLMGVGDPASLVEAVAIGVDQFDCVLPTRLGRHGTALTSAGKLNLRNARHATANEPIDETCGCAVCARHTRGYLRHLFQTSEPTASRLLTLHNLAWTFSLLDGVRSAISAGTFEAFRARVLSVWNQAS